MKRKTIIAIVFGVSSAMLVTSFSAFNGINVFEYKAIETNLYTLTFAKQNKLTDKTEWSSIPSCETELDSKNNKVSFKADGVKDNANGWQSFNDGGYFANIDHIIGMDSITFNGTTTDGEATATVYYSGDVIDSSKLDGYKSQALTFNNVAGDKTITFDYKPNYILTKFTGQPIDINSAMIIINNECKDFYSTVTINGLDETMGSVSGAGAQYIGSEVTLTAKANDGYEFKGWYDGEKLLTAETTYTYTQPVEGITFTVKFEKGKLPKPEKGTTYTFGSYPQTHVTDSALVTSLDALIETTPDTDETGWTNYKDYYVESIKDKQSVRWFKDVEYNSTKYRAVYMTQTPANNNGYTTNKTHYFRFDPIEWNVLDDKGLVLAKYLLDSSQNYYHDTSINRNIGGKTVYPSNYEHSNIRSWLNNSFLDNAFVASEQKNISTTTVDNSGNSYGIPDDNLACNDTQDKIFLMSKNDIYNNNYGFTDDSATRQAKATDYAKCMGCYANSSNGYSYWWLRSPYPNLTHCASDVSSGGDWDYNSVYEFFNGVRPALTLTL